MKRYWLFSGDAYYPDGGWSDFTKDFDTVEEAFSHFLGIIKEHKWFHIVDSVTQQFVVINHPNYDYNKG